MANVDHVVVDVNMLWCDGMLSYVFCGGLLTVICHGMWVAIATEGSYICIQGLSSKWDYLISVC